GVGVDPAGDLHLPQDGLLLVRALDRRIQRDRAHPDAVALRLAVPGRPRAHRVAGVRGRHRAAAARALLVGLHRDVEGLGERARRRGRGAVAGHAADPGPAVIAAVAVATTPLHELGDVALRGVALVDRDAGPAILVHRAVVIVLGHLLGLVPDLIP